MAGLPDDPCPDAPPVGAPARGSRRTAPAGGRPCRAASAGRNGRFARWLAGWRLALRMAHRDARRHWGRSVLVLVMVGVPVALVAGGLAVLSSTHASPANALPRLLGAAQARIDVGDRRIEQDYVARGVSARDRALPLPGAEPGQAPTPEAIQRLTGGRLLPVTRAEGIFPGLGVGRVLGVDGRDPATDGMVGLVSGRWPQGPDEAAVTPYAARRGLPTSGDLTFRLDTTQHTVRIVGVAEGWTPTAASVHLIVPPQSLRAADPEGPAFGGAFGGVGATTYLLARDEPVSWAQVRQWNEHGLLVISRQVVTSPPPASELPPSIAGWGSASEDVTLPVVIVGGAAILLVTTLLAGPAFAVSATRQRHSLALAAVNGAPGRQLRRVVLAQALVLGGLGSAAAAALGVGSAWLLLHVLRARGVDVPALPFRPEPARVGLVVLMATAAALVAAAIPARGLRRLDVITALRGQAPAAAPRRRTPLVGLALIGLGTATMIGSGVALAQRDLGDAAAYGAAVGAIVLAIGGVLIVPWALVAIAARAGGAPLPLRLAARDAARQRGRSAPATVAVMATVAAVTAILIAGGSSAAKDESSYAPRAPLGTARVDVRGSAADLSRLGAESDRAVPGSVAVLMRDPRYGPSNGPDDGPDRPVLRLAVQPKGCPARAAFDWAYARDLAGDPPPGPNGEAPDYPCQGVSAALGGDLLLVERAGLDALPGLPEPVRRTLAEGGAVGINPRLAGGARLVTATVTWYASGPDQPDRPPTVADITERALPTLIVSRNDLASLTRQRDTPQVVLTLETARAAGLVVQPSTAVVVGPGGAPLSPAQEVQLADALAAIGMSVKVERGYESTTALAFAIVLAVTLLIVLVAALSSTALSLAEQQADLATLTAIGATRRARRAMAAAQALVVAGLGTAFGMALGFVPGIAMTWPATASRWDPETHLVTATAPTIVVPWLPLVVLLLVVPLIAAALAAVGVRRSPPLLRRLA